MSTPVDYSADDLIHAQDLHWTNGFFGLKFARGLLFFASILGIFYAYLAHSTSTETWDITLAAAAGFFGVIVVLVIASLINRHFFLPRSARKALVQMKEYHGQWQYELEDHKLSIKTPRGGALLPFTDFMKWSESDRTFLLYRTEKMFNFLPKNQVDAAFLQVLREELAAAHVPRANFRNS
jgi:hypothetical protein